MLTSSKDLLLKVEQIEKIPAKQEKDIKLVFDYLNHFIKDQDKLSNQIGFKL